MQIYSLVKYTSVLGGTNKHPTNNKFTWASAGDGDDIIEISPK